MLFCEGDYAYEIERARDSATQVLTGWRYHVYRIWPDHIVLRSGDRATQEEAESAARRTLESMIKANQQIEGQEGTRAA